MALRRSLFAAAVFSTACSAAYAERPAPPPATPRSVIGAPQIALDIAPAKRRAPYDVQIMRSTGESLPTYGFRDRFYVQGNANERYVIRIANPTDHRIEAVVSVDGLDVIDGENGDLRKRGYVVPAYGETRIDGFRTSLADVATFRFSTVSGSYAGQQGKPRNVGVIAVALFEEQVAAPEPQIIIGGRAPRRPEPRRPYDEPRAVDDDAAASETTADRPAATASAGAARDAKRAAEAAPAVRRPPPPAPMPTQGGTGGEQPSSDDDDDGPGPSPGEAQRERLGLGTEFGEQRRSAVGYTQFVRAPGPPVAIAELRYNDAAGLMALGIAVQPRPDAGELMVRETADPFPGDRYAKPPR